MKSKRAVGKIQFTGDAWSSRSRTSWFCSTAHWVSRLADGGLAMRSTMIGFQKVYGAHTAKNLASVAFSMLERVGVLHVVGSL
jgi:hypothetical protein